MRVIGYGSGLVAPEVLANAGAEVVLGVADVLGMLGGEFQSTVE